MMKIRVQNYRTNVNDRGDRLDRDKQKIWNKWDRNDEIIDRNDRNQLQF